MTVKDIETLKQDVEIALADNSAGEISADDVKGAIIDTIDTLNADTFLPTPDSNDFDETYFYFGWSSVNGEWLAQRQIRATGISENATQENNPLYTNINDAFNNGNKLNYI